MEDMIAFLQGSKVQDFDFVPLMIRRLTITGSTMRPGTTVQKGAIAADLRAKVWPALDAGRCPPLARVTANNNGSGTVKLSGIRLAGVGGYQRFASAAHKT